LERTIDGGSVIHIPRVQYGFTHDEFDGATFGNRHGMTLSSSTLWNDCHRSIVYWAIDYTDFIDDGILPSVTSRDGWTNALGLSHTVEVSKRYLRSVTAGADVQRADVTGSDFAYNGVNLFAEAEVPLCDRLMLLLQAGWGYRDYFDFEFTPSRNEHVWNARAELRRQLTELVTLSAVFNYDRFDSENPLFEAERYLSGLLLTYQF
jgi:hypothetical protein